MSEKVNKPTPTFKEFELIDSCVRPLSSINVYGVGDDCATLKLSNSRYQVFSTDTLIEGVHFRRDFSSWFDIGWKSLAVNISDVAAMGAQAKYFLVSIQLNNSVSKDNVRELYQGIYDLADQAEVLLIGGDTVSSNTVGISITIIGESRKQPILRSGANVGDELWVSGVIGEASCGLALLNKNIEPHLLNSSEKCLLRHRAPRVSFENADKLNCSSMIDISDGLFQDSGHLALQSEVDIEIDTNLLPLPFAEAVSDLLLYTHLSGGDDYQLLLTAAEGSQIERYGFVRIGKVLEKTKAQGQVWVKSLGSKIRLASEVLNDLDLGMGYQHFS